MPANEDRFNMSHVFTLEKVTPDGVPNEILTGPTDSMPYKDLTLEQTDAIEIILLEAEAITKPKLSKILGGSPAIVAFEAMIAPDGDPGTFEMIGNQWIKVDETAAHPDIEYHFQKLNRSGAAQWIFTAVPPGNYDITIAWTAQPVNATNVQYRVYDGVSPDGSGEVASALVDQQVAPSGSSFSNVGINSGICVLRMDKNPTEGDIVAGQVTIKKL